MDLRYLESTRHHRLKDTFRVVFLRRSSDFLNVFLAVALERLLVWGSVGQIFVRVPLANTLGEEVQLADQPFANALEEVVLLFAVPGEVELEHWGLPRVSRSGVVFGEGVELTNKTFARAIKTQDITTSFNAVLGEHRR